MLQQSNMAPPFDQIGRAFQRSKVKVGTPLEKAVGMITRCKYRSLRHQEPERSHAIEEPISHIPNSSDRDSRITIHDSQCGTLSSHTSDFEFSGCSFAQASLRSAPARRSQRQVTFSDHVEVMRVPATANRRWPQTSCISPLAQEEEKFYVEATSAFPGIKVWNIDD